MSKILLDVEDLVTHFIGKEAYVSAVDGVSYKVYEGETMGLVGESGCGKTVSVLSIMRLVPPPGRTLAGRALFNGRDLLQLDDEEMREIRGKEIAMVFQDPLTALNPVFRVGDQIEEIVAAHQDAPNYDEIRDKAKEMLDLVQVPSDRMDEYPHEFSGGMRQRIMIAMALMNRPRMLILDEPTSALDVIIQAQVLDLIQQLQRELKLSSILITHDLGLLADMSQHATVMYAGRPMEYGDIETIFESSVNPYTQGLLESLPRLDKVQDRLTTISGLVPDLKAPPKGCRFHPRCARAKTKCVEERPPYEEYEKGHFSACWYPG